MTDYERELALCGASETIDPARLRAAYERLVEQTSLVEQTGGTDAQASPVLLFDRPLVCFHRPSVLSLFREVFLYQHYNPIRPLTAGAVIIDAGANIGLFSIYIGMTQPDARIVAFEADPVTFATLEQNAATFLPAGTCELHHAALSYSPGETQVLTDAANPNRCTHTIVPGMLAEAGASECLVPCRPLSSYLEDVETVGLLKLDVEGAEFDVLCDLADRGQLSKCHNIIAEVHRAAFGRRPTEEDSRTYTIGALTNLLEGQGFTIDLFAQAARPFRPRQLSETFMLRAC